MKKVCIVFPYPMGKDFLSGGVSKLIVANILAIKDRYNVCLIAPQENEGLIKYFDDNYPDVKIHLTKFYTLQRFIDTKSTTRKYFETFKRILLSFKYNSNLKKAIEEEKPDLVHFHGEVTFNYLKYGRRIKAKTIFHTSCFRFSNPPFLKWLVVSTANRNADLIISPTKSISDLFGKSSKNIIITNPIIRVDATDKNKSNDLEDAITGFHGLKLLFVGRICQVKQVHLIVEAIANLTAEEKEKTKLFIIGKANNSGDEVYYNDMKEYIARNQIESNVIFLGYKNNVDDYMKVADVGVLISKSEAISMAGIEYLFNSLPIIGFDNPGINELIRNEINGFMVNDGDVDGLTNCIRSFYDKERLSRMKKDAYQCAINEYSIESFQKRILNAYSQSLLK